MSVSAVAERLGGRVPEAASDVRAGHREGQDDALLLAFVVPSGDVDGFLAGMDPEEPVEERAVPFAGESVPAAPFGHLDLPEPVGLHGVRTAQVCAPCDDDLNALHVAVAAIDGERSRVYVKGVD
ncbi:hypothetical protein PV749_20730 [Streptomyces sp. ID03-2B]|uniref:hypothetical protein n=1 Tax=Streptomyces TaxID=1883 RepID=UPI0029A6D53F|nr:hypothetical protein [Streptomyces sp. ID03-2B]MDX3593549.1 hypothetical protein [Streptomyces sp. ID03-2B]